MGVRLTRVVTKPCTLELAEEIFSLPRVEKDRVLLAKRVDKLIENIRTGPLRPFNWAVATDVSTGIKYRVNGQHSSFAMLTKKIPVEGVCTIEEYECDDYKGVAALWATFDSEVSARKKKEIHAAYCGASKRLDESINETFLHSVNSGLYYFVTAYDGQLELSNSVRSELTDKYAYFVNWSAKIFTKKAFIRAPILASAAYTWVLEDLNSGGNGFTFAKPSPAVEGFWGRLLSGENLDMHKPIRLLREFIISTKVASTGCQVAWIRDGQNKAASPWVFSNFCLSAWNAYRTNRTFSELKKPGVRDARYWFRIVLDRIGENYSRVNRADRRRLQESIDEKKSQYSYSTMKNRAEKRAEKDLELF